MTAAGSSTNNSDVNWVAAESETGSTGQSAASTQRQSALQELETLKIQRARLSRYLRPKHPKIVKLDAEIARAQQLLDVYRRQSRDQLAASRQAIQMKIANIQSSITNWEARVVEANTRIAEANRLKVNVQREQSVYDRLMLLLQNVRISRNIDQDTLAVLEPATPAVRSYRTEESSLTLAGVGGLGLGIIVLIAMRDDRLNSILEVNEKLGELVVGQVPEVQSLQAGKPVPLLGINDERHAYVESYRNLRSALLFMTAEAERPRTLLVTSALPHEGKSTVAANLARALALGGARVVLVDGDLRKGVLHELMELKREPGLAELLRQPDQPEKVLQTNSLPNLAFIARGHSAMHAGDLFLSAAFDQMLARLRREFDYVVIDSSPVFAADDTTTLAPKVDATLFVVRSGFSSARPVREALSLLYQRQARVLGVIFNQADASARSYYYYKYADYGGTAKAG